MRTDAPRRRPRPHAVVVSAFALFLVLTALLAYQLRTGHDPAIGAAQAIAQTPRAAPVVLRKIIKRVIVVSTADEGDDGGSATTSTRPIASAPQPAPAPLQTRSS